MFKKNKKSIGIDISDFSVEVVELEKQNKELSIRASNRILLKHGIVEQGKIQNIKKLQVAIKVLLSTAKPRAINGQRVIFSLPDNQVYTNVFQIQISEKKGIKQAIESEIRDNIPLSRDEISYTYKVVKEKNIKARENGLLVILIVVKKSFLQEWDNFFESIGLTIDYFETEALSLFRGMYRKHPDKAIGILDIGASRSHFSIFSKNGVEYAFSSNCAGNLITKSIAEKKLIDIEDAEQIKLAGGINNNEIDLEEFFTKDLKSLFDEVNKTIKYYNTNETNKNSFDNNLLQKVFITGGSSNLKNLSDFINKQGYAYKVELGDSVLKSKLIDRNYIQASGSAIRGLENQWENTDPFLLVHKQEVNKVANEVKLKVKNFINDKLKHFSKKILIWVTVLVVLIIIIFVSPFLKSFKGNQSSQQGHFSDSFKTYINIFGSNESLTQKIFKVRVININSEKAIERDELIATQRNLAQEKLFDGELLVPEPINKADLNGNLIFPLTLKWLAYDKEEIKEHCLKQGRMKYLNKDLQITNASITQLDVKPKIGLVGATGDCDIFSSNKLVENAEFADKKKVNLEKKIYIKINQIGSNLNIRSGPGVNYKIVDTASAGSKFEWQAEKDGWYKIKIVGSNSAWVSSRYSEKIYN